MVWGETGNVVVSTPTSAVDPPTGGATGLRSGSAPSRVVAALSLVVAAVTLVVACVAAVSPGVGAGTISRCRSGEDSPRPAAKPAMASRQIHNAMAKRFIPVILSLLTHLKPEL